MPLPLGITGDLCIDANILSCTFEGMSTIGGGDGGENFQLDRKKSEQAFDVFILGFNESAEKKSKVGI